MTYRDDLAGAQSRAHALERELTQARSQGAADRSRLDYLERELQAARQAISAMQQGLPSAYPEQHYQHSSATTILVLGILSLVVCSVLGPFAWHQGNQELQRIQAGLVDPSTHGMVTAGRVCGIVGTVLLGIGFVAVLLGFAVGMAS